MSGDLIYLYMYTAGVFPMCFVTHTISRVKLKKAFDAQKKYKSNKNYSDESSLNYEKFMKNGEDGFGGCQVSFKIVRLDNKESLQKQNNLIAQLKSVMNECIKYTEVYIEKYPVIETELKELVKCVEDEESFKIFIKNLI